MQSRQIEECSLPHMQSIQIEECSLPVTKKSMCEQVMFIFFLRDEEKKVPHQGRGINLFK
jgi:hypothetical protein